MPATFAKAERQASAPEREQGGLDAPTPELASKPDPAAYAPTDKEAKALARYKKRCSETPPAPRIKIKQNAAKVEFWHDHPDDRVGLRLLAEALGSSDWDFVAGLQSQLANSAERRGKLNEADVNFLLAVVKGIQPRDQLETMLAAQMAVTHEAIMTFARRLGNVENTAQQDSAERAFNKLARTFALQLEALKRYRSGGEQKLTVQHVTVSDGGQAIVGNVTQSPRPSAPAPASPPALTQSAQTSMPAIDEREAAPTAEARKRRNGRRSSA